MKRIYLYCLMIACFSFYSCNENDSQDNYNESTIFYKGMDLSFLEELEQSGLQFKDENNNVISNNYAYLSSKGVNLVRIRLWLNNPNGLYDLDHLKRQALRAQENGMEFLLDFHYSSTWADPGSQRIPSNWSNYSHQELTVAIENYSKNVLQELNDQGTLPKFVQIGNETDNGFLWPIGKIYDSGNENWNNYIDLTKAAINGVKRVSPTSKIIIHKADIATSEYFFQQLIYRNVEFDVIGLSYYPWWQTTNLDDIEQKLEELAQSFNQEILLVETAYPFTLNWNDNKNNIVGLQNQLIPEYGATPVGQRNYLLRIHNTIKNIPKNKGIGFCYWAPDWVAVAPGVSTSTQGSSWENLALFNFENRVTPAIEIYAIE
ncbi:MAG: glycosyl hydrolase 53 family protein [Bacteroidota bacterium]|nr:glycosyl hydrolase 53 family protein [Bacteroidota bacterium]